MRMIDWSSDVCSSDLRVCVHILFPGRENVDPITRNRLDMRVPDGGAAILVFDSTGRDEPVFPARRRKGGCVGLSCPGRGAGGSGRLVDLTAVSFGIVLPARRPDPFNGIGRSEATHADI